MRETIAAAAVLGLVTLGGPARAADDLDAPRADAAHHKVEFENEWVRVVRATIPPHEKTALHDHPSLVSVLLTDADIKVTAADGKVSEVHAKKGTATWRGPTVPPHVAENIGDRPYEQILVEPKGAGNPGWKAPPQDASKVTQTDKVEFENDWVRIVRYRVGKGEKTPMHDHPTGVQIVLTDAKVRQTTPDGKTAELSGKAGTVRLRPAFTHSLENLGDTFEGILVDLKGAPATASR